jgi:predicted nucleic acid-binding protein
MYGVVRLSAVVLAELRRGALRMSESALIDTLEKNHRILTPTEANWLESGRILAKMHLDYGFTPEKLRDLHFDVLIALTARSHGAILITSNRSDFELIHGYRSFRLEIW